MQIVRKPHAGRQPLLFRLRRRDVERRLGCRDDRHRRYARVHARKIEYPALVPDRFFRPQGWVLYMAFAAAGGLREIDALKGLIGQLGPLPFHKTVLLLSNGFTRPPDQLEYWDSMIRSAIGRSEE